MNKPTLLCLLPLCLSLFACTKSEGSYEVPRKISHIYTSVSGWYTNLDSDNQSLYTTNYYTPRYNSETWSWNGRRPSQIDYYYSDGTAYGLENYIYSYGKITSKTDRISACSAEFFYSGKHLSSVHWYNLQRLYAVSHFSHNDNKISEISTTVYSMGSKSLQCLPLLPPNHLISSDPTLASAYSPTPSKASSNIVYSERLALTWSGDNIASVSCYNANNTLLWQWFFSYDSHTNPLHNFWTKHEYNGLYLPLFGSVNNIIYDSIQSANGSHAVNTYQYSYDDDYPSSCSRTSHTSGTYPREETITTEYSYL